MRDFRSRGLRLAVVVLFVEVLLAMFLVSDTWGLFAIMGMALVGIAWLPAAWMIAAEIRQGDAGSGLLAWLVALACVAAGLVCLGAFARWTLLALVVA